MSGGFSFGSDPEFMIVTEATQEPISAIKVLKGHGKANKIGITGSQAMFYDNVLVEFNVDPGHTLADFLANFGKCLDFAEKRLGSRYTLKAQASQIFPEKECDDEEAFVFGCDPEFCIYNVTEDGAILPSEPPSLPQGNTFRSCGGHIHIGHPIATIERGNPPMVVAIMDTLVGNTALLIDKDETSEARRKLYGGAGTHRIASYGLEYRTLSNFWLSSPFLTEIVYRLTRFAIQTALTNPDFAKNIVQPQELQTIINRSLKADAAALYDKLRGFLPHELQNLIEEARQLGPSENMEYEWEAHLAPLRRAA